MKFTTEETVVMFGWVTHEESDDKTLAQEILEAHQKAGLSREQAIGHIAHELEQRYRQFGNDCSSNNLIHDLVRCALGATSWMEIAVALVQKSQEKKP